ncbi:MAG: hypothetical protein IJB19_00580 [Clostridia bacterium]|nr:hypothetical protein [Clostridia bacterium]
MNATTRNNTMNITDKIAVTTEELAALLSCGRKTAIQIGRDAEACIQYGKRVLWNVSRVKTHLDAISA